MRDFFEKMSNSLNKAIKYYENTVFVGDLNINVLCPEKDILNHLNHFADLIRTANSRKEPCGTALDVTLTNKPKCFHHTSVLTTDLTEIVITSFYHV